MANSANYKNIKFRIGDTIKIDYKLKEGDKERLQPFEGTVLQVKGSTLETKMVTVRKISHSGIGVERIIPLASPQVTDVKVLRTSSYHKAKLYFVRYLSHDQLRAKLYHKLTIKKPVAKKRVAKLKKNHVSAIQSSSRTNR